MSRILQFLRRLFKSAVNVNRALIAQLMTLAVDPRVTPRLLFIMLRMFRSEEGEPLWLRTCKLMIDATRVFST